MILWGHLPNVNVWFQPEIVVYRQNSQEVMNPLEEQCNPQDGQASLKATQ